MRVALKMIGISHVPHLKTERNERVRSIGKCTVRWRHAATGGQGHGERSRSFLGGAGCFLGRFRMDGWDAGGFELGQMKSKLVLYAGECGGCQTITTDMLRADRRKLRDPRFGCRIRTSRTTERRREALDVSETWHSAVISKLTSNAVRYDKNHNTSHLISWWYNTIDVVASL